MLRSVMCDCAPIPTKAESDLMGRWLAGENIEGFPLHDSHFTYRYTDDRYKAPKIDWDIETAFE